MKGGKVLYDELVHKGAFYNITMDTKNKEDKFPKQERYKSPDGKLDHIDECAANYTPEEFRGAMKFTIGKYQSRLGKKDNIVQEVTKIADYANRWLQYEIELENKNEEK